MSIYTAAGIQVTTFSAYENALGIKTVRWSPNSQILAIGSYDDKIRLLNCITWKVIAELEPKAQLNGAELVIIF